MEISKETYRKSAAGMMDFIANSPTCFHAAAAVCRRLDEAGYKRVSEADDWKNAGHCFYTIRNDSSVMAVRIPDGEPLGFHILAAHCDSPCFKVKEKPEVQAEGAYTKLNVEGYGGMIMSSWFDRPLSIAGRLAVDTPEGVRTVLVNVDEDLCVIPNLAIHMNREINNGYKYNVQVDLEPLYSGKDGDVLARVAAAAGVGKEDVLAHDLFLYPRQKGLFVGENGEFVMSPRLDDLQSVYAAVTAFTQEKPERYINVCAVFDNEEVGSGTRQGADSTFLADVLRRTCTACGFDGDRYDRLLAESFVISSDNAHAVHPNHPEKADPTNRPVLNGGLVIKYHGGQKYTSDAFSAAKMKSWCRKADVPYQTYTNRSDVAGGSTLGHISTSHVSAASVDVGLPQLAMHSAVETTGTQDTELGIRAFQAFFRE